MTHQYQITKLVAEVLGFEGDRGGQNAGTLYGPQGGHIQVPGERVKLNVTPTPDTRNPADPDLTRNGEPNINGSPRVLWRWGYYEPDGRKVFCSKGGDGQPYAGQGRPDIFELQSYVRKNLNDTSGPGLTPVLLLNDPAGPGVLTAFAFACIEAAENNGLDVESNEVTWLID